MYRLKKNGYNLISIIFLIIIILIVFNYKSIYNKLKPNISFGEIKLEEIFSQKKDSFNYTKTFFILNNKIISIQNSKLIYRDDNLEKVWAKEINGQDLRVFSKNEKIYVLDASLGDIYKLDSKGNIEAKIYSLGGLKEVIYFSDSKFIFINNDNNLIYLDNKLTIKTEKKLDFNNILDINYSNKYIYFLSLEDNNDYYYTKILKMDLNFEIISNKNIRDNIFYNNIIENDQIYLNNNHKLLKIDKKDNILWEKKFENSIKKIYKDEKFYITTNNKNDKSVDILKVLDDNGVILDSVDLPISNLKGIEKINEDILIYNKEKISILDKKYSIKMISNLDKEILNIKILKENNIMVNTKSHIYIYKLIY
ncbi:MAG: hypothetical protein ACQEQE_06760 [Bacillota bacterium]